MARKKVPAKKIDHKMQHNFFFHQKCKDSPKKICYVLATTTINELQTLI